MFLRNCFSLQLLNLSGILAVFFCGIVMSHYTWHNVTECSRVTTKYVGLFSASKLLNCCFHYYLFWSNGWSNIFYSFLSPILSFFVSRHAFATLSFIAETFLFLYVGMDVLDIEKWKFVSNRYDIFHFSFEYIILVPLLWDTGVFQLKMLKNDLSWNHNWLVMLSTKF